MASIIQVPCRQAFRDSLAGGNGSSGPQFQPLIIPLMWQPGKKSSPAGLAPTSPLIIDESRWWRVVVWGGEGGAGAGGSASAAGLSLANAETLICRRRH